MNENYSIGEGLGMDEIGEVWLTDWTGYFAPGALGKIKHVAIAAEDWQDINLAECEGRLQPGKDARLRVAEFTALERPSLVMVAELDDPSYGALDDLVVDVTTDDNMADGYEERKSVQAAAIHESYNDWLDDARAVFQDLEESRPGWKAPDVQLTGMIR